MVTFWPGTCEHEFLASVEGIKWNTLGPGKNRGPDHHPGKKHKRRESERDRNKRRGVGRKGKLLSETEREEKTPRPRPGPTRVKPPTRNANHQHPEGEREPELWAGLMGNKPHHHHHHQIIKPLKPPRETSRRVDLTRVSGSGGSGLPRQDMGHGILTSTPTSWA